ncbi:MAG: S-methyl-5'-thioadenosine phosphorylase [Spirochaetales bacterium]|nr:S-methyl-5'-thioadenosine phosphorylase [Spirochaetales bacterium]
MNASIGIIGGSGLENFDSGKIIGKVDIPTPFGMPSDLFTLVELNGTIAAILPRHGKGHRILPTDVNSKANMWAFKSLGVHTIFAVSAVGSLAEEYKPGEFAVTTNIIDRTRQRPATFFGDGIVGHVAFADPFCIKTQALIIEALEQTSHPFHKEATLIAMEGPAFSSKAESHMYRSWNGQIIGMTALPEAKLAREAEMCYASIGMVTDYDCWREHEESVTVEYVMETMRKNVDGIKKLVPLLIEKLAKKDTCVCHSAAAGAIMTDLTMVPYETKRKLDIFYNKYWGNR